jgi:mannitol-specific phosphotransferase system IIBC component
MNIILFSFFVTYTSSIFIFLTNEKAWKEDEKKDEKASIEDEKKDEKASIEDEKKDEKASIEDEKKDENLIFLVFIVVLYLL